MKGQISWRSTPKLRMSDILWTLLPALLWLLAIYSRGSLINPRCTQNPELCTQASLIAMDRPAVGLEVPGADALSFTTQGLSGVLALSIPPLWHAGMAIAGTVTPMAALVGAGTDLVIFAQTASWNGLFTESAHLITQRPRPFVYTDPQRARDFSNYTSFYSGHTSFATAASVFLLLTLAGRGASLWVLCLAGLNAYTMMSLTGMYRVLAGRHFPTDVLFAAFFGTGVALMIAYLHRKPLKRI
jgi:membrane-associated phospholipid phosphatase